MTKQMDRTRLTSRFWVGISCVLLTATLGCGGANSGPGTATDQNELLDYLEANPELKEVPPDESNVEPLDDPDVKNAPRQAV